MTIMAASVERLGSLRVKLEGLYPVVLRHGSCGEVAAYAGAAMDVSKLLEDAESCSQLAIQTLVGVSSVPLVSLIWLCAMNG